VFGALPAGDLSAGFVAVLVPIVAGFFVAVVMRPRLVRELGDESSAGWLLLSAAAIGVWSGLILGLLAAFSGGSAGPGRLTTVGPDALSAALWATLEVTIGAVAGFVATKQQR